MACQESAGERNDQITWAHDAYAPFVTAATLHQMSAWTECREFWKLVQAQLDEDDEQAKTNGQEPKSPKDDGCPPWYSHLDLPGNVFHGVRAMPASKGDAGKQCAANWGSFRAWQKVEDTHYSEEYYNARERVVARYPKVTGHQQLKLKSDMQDQLTTWLDFLVFLEQVHELDARVSTNDPENRGGYCRRYIAHAAMQHDDYLRTHLQQSAQVHGETAPPQKAAKKRDLGGLFGRGRTLFSAPRTQDAGAQL
ncbi:hypothetical protein NOR_03806 [Metarhizium rileyi]|uniref:Uncharacterized protein n=1 Tax=Metarhizium rileyi (strain RCEF 4871) TaxID=1649241 RepID=A0A167FBW2_METRR|nr:hypothetical protein NOR_03806 [Metarhizium rileyi RCEF 4871]